MLRSMLGLFRLAARVSRVALVCVAPVCAALLPYERAAAHGDPPKAHAVIRADAEGPLLVKLGTGFAARVAAGRFRFVCPALWGGELTAPAAALADGDVVVGANAGLMLLAPGGTLRAHPDPAAQGLSTEIVATSQGVFALRYNAGRSELVHVDAEQVRVLWSDSTVWYSLAPLAHGLLLLRSSGSMVEQLTLSFTGAEQARELAVAPRNVDYVFARSQSDQPFALLLYQNASELGAVKAGAFSRVAQASSSIAGPIAAPSGTLVALDGQLHRLEGTQLTPLADTTYVGCLEQGEHDSYACTRTGVARVSAEGVGEELFALTWLVAPDLTQLSDEKARGRCDYQWQDLRFDLLALGMPLRFEDEPVSDAATPRDEAGVSHAADGGLASADAGDEHSAPEAEPEPRSRRTSGCSLGAAHAPTGAWWLAPGALGLLVARRAGRRRR